METSRLRDPRADVAGDFDFLAWVDMPRNSPGGIEVWEGSPSTSTTQSSEAYTDTFAERRRELPRIQKQRDSHGKIILKNRKPRKVACFPCQKAKVRCDISQDTPCSRCKRIKRECISHPHCPRRRSKLQETEQTTAEVSSGLPRNNTSIRLGILSNPTSQAHIVLNQVNPSYLSSQTLRLSLWDAFVEYVHPHIPVIEIDSCGGQAIDMLSLVMERKLPSLIYLSIMYAGIPHLDADCLRVSGFDSYVALGKTMREDYKLLRQCGHPNHWVSSVYSLLLMSSWYPDETRSEAWTQIKMASGMLTTLKYRAVRSQDVKQFRRLWWSCFIRDQTIALCMQQNPSMQYPQFGIPMITQRDFEALPVVETNNQRIRGNGAENSEATTWCNPCTTWFVESAKLAILLGSGRAQQHLDGILAPGERGRCSQSSGSTSQETAALHTRLVRWYYNIPSEVKYCKNGDELSSRNGMREYAVPQILSASMMFTYYLNLVRENEPNSNGAIGDDLMFERAQHQKYVEEGAVEVLNDLCEKLKLSHVPTFLIDGVVSLAIKSFLGTDITGESCVNSSIRGFQRCLQVFHTMGNRLRVDQQDHVDFRFALLQAMYNLNKEKRRTCHGEWPAPDTTPSLEGYTSCESEIYADPDTSCHTESLTCSYVADDEFQGFIDESSLPGLSWLMWQPEEPLAHKARLGESCPPVPDWAIEQYHDCDKPVGREY